jgi:hypothetical protein
MTVGVVADACGHRLREWRLAACRRLTDDALAFVRLNCVSEPVPVLMTDSGPTGELAVSTKGSASGPTASGPMQQTVKRALRLLDVTRSYALSAAACRQFIAASRAQGVRFLHHLVKPHLLP